MENILPRNLIDMLADFTDHEEDLFIAELDNIVEEIKNIKLGTEIYLTYKHGGGLLYDKIADALDNFREINCDSNMIIYMFDINKYGIYSPNEFDWLLKMFKIKNLSTNLRQIIHITAPQRLAFIVGSGSGETIVVINYVKKCAAKFFKVKIFNCGTEIIIDKLFSNYDSAMDVFRNFYVVVRSKNKNVRLWPLEINVLGGHKYVIHRVFW